jgi:hypothetical protein
MQGLYDQPGVTDVQRGGMAFVRATSSPTKSRAASRASSRPAIYARPEGGAAVWTLLRSHCSAHAMIEREPRLNHQPGLFLLVQTRQGGAFQAWPCLAIAATWHGAPLLPVPGPASSFGAIAIVAGLSSETKPMV